MSDLYDSVRRAIAKRHTDQTDDGLARRSFIKLTGVAGGGLLLASVAPSALYASDAADAAPAQDTLLVSAELNAFVKVATDGKITIYSSNAEMGQGIKTALPMVIAEELGAKWEDVVVVQSPVDEARFGRHGAGGSTTVNRTFDQMRTMGASAREMFIGAGALVMEVARDELTAENSRVTHVSGRYRTFAQLATIAAKQEVPDPDKLVFKEREDYTIIGSAVSGVDNLAITTGLALFGIDTRVPDMLYAAYHKCPAIGGTVVSANIAEIKQLPGVVDAFVVKGNGDVRELLDGVAIVGTNTHAVFSAKRKLKVKWDESQASKDSWSAMAKRAQGLKDQRGSEEGFRKGNVDDVFADKTNTTLEAFYEYPFVAHLCMEPMNCTAHYQKAGTTTNPGTKDQVELWIPTQAPTRAYGPAKSLFGLEAEQVKVHQMRLGGSFGRRVYNEYVCEVMEISKRMGAPVKLTWSREDDIHHDFFRVGGFQAVKGSVDAKGKLVAFENHHMGMQTDGKPVVGSGFRKTEFPMQNIDNALVSHTMFDIKNTLRRGVRHSQTPTRLSCRVFWMSWPMHHNEITPSFCWRFWANHAGSNPITFAR